MKNTPTLLWGAITPILFANAHINVFTGVFDVTNCVSRVINHFRHNVALFCCSCIRLFVFELCFCAGFCMVLCRLRFYYSCFELCSFKSGSSESSPATVWRKWQINYACFFGGKKIYAALAKLHDNIPIFLSRSLIGVMEITSRSFRFLPAVAVGFVFIEVRSLIPFCWVFAFLPLCARRFRLSLYP